MYISNNDHLLILNLFADKTISRHGPSQQSEHWSRLAQPRKNLKTNIDLNKKIISTCVFFDDQNKPITTRQLPKYLCLVIEMQHSK